ncbi:MAG: hypothetical protein WAM07_02990 [Halobacillus sp.]|uniref:GNAT family N-acetyltransferase n=1 Tax=Halobacillus sp. TaxID=56800 RepID=UPI003BAE4D07
MLKGHLVDLKPVSRKDLENLYTWANDESLTFLSSGSESANQNNNPLEALQAQYEKNLNAQHLWEHGTVFIVYSKATQEPIGKCDYRKLNPVTRAAEIGGSQLVNAITGGEGMEKILFTLCSITFFIPLI